MNVSQTHGYFFSLPNLDLWYNWQFEKPHLTPGVLFTSLPLQTMFLRHCYAEWQAVNFLEEERGPLLLLLEIWDR